MNLKLERRGGQIVVVPEAEPGNRPCQVCNADADVNLVRFSAPRGSARPLHTVYVRLCGGCLGALAARILVAEGA